MSYPIANTFDTFGVTSLIDHSVSLFEHAWIGGSFYRFFAKLTRRSYHLLDLNSYPTEKRHGYFAGQWDVALDQIRGTEGRQNDFDNRFNPLDDRTRARWQSVARAFEQGQDLPPVELIQVGDIYFVRDGHHRISVARAYGRATIPARVTVW